jgi:hypothetical protein
MKRFILFLISSCAVLFACAQEEIIFDSIPKIQIEDKTKVLNIEKPLRFENSFSMPEIDLFDEVLFNQPLLPDYSKNLDLKKYLNFSKSSTGSFSTAGYIVSPFYTNGMVFNHATYQLSDKFSVGGNSFGAQSVFDRPKINSSINDMSTKGASMFMQYKVSKNFKVETRVSVSSHKSPWEP